MRALLVTILSTLAMLSLGAGCQDESTEPTSLLEPPPAEEGFQLAMSARAEPGEEVWACAVYDLPITEFTGVNQVEFVQNAGTHHMTLSTLGLTPTEDLEPGMYDCSDLYGDASLMENQIMFFGSQGTGEGFMNLPTGVAANFPPGLTVIHELHYVNVSDQPIDMYSIVNAYSIPQSEIQESIWGGQVRDETLNIPARETVTEWTRCVMNEDVEVLFLAGHMHQLGIEFTIAPFDGTETGEIFYRNDDWHVPGIKQYDPPLVVPAGEGFEFACTFRNTTDEAVSYGPSSTDEMCNMAIVHTPFSLTALCEVVETSDGVLWSPED